MSTLDPSWLHSPCAAMQLWRADGAAAWCLNASAQVWSEASGLGDDVWQAAADALLAMPAQPQSGCLTVGAQQMRHVRVPLPAGWLVWLTPVEDGLPGADELLDLIDDFVCIGRFERNLGSGEARWDANMFRLFGFEPASRAPSFEQMLLRMHPDDRQRTADLRGDMLRTGGRRQLHIRVLPPDGEQRYVHAFIELRNGESGRAPCLRGALVDESDIAGQAHAHQRESIVLSRALELAMISVWRIDLPRQRIHYNDIGYQITGVPPTPEGMPLDEMRALSHPDDTPAVLAAAERAMAGDEIVDVEARYRNIDGSWRHLLTRRVAERDAEGRVVALAGVSLDQTQQIAERSHAQSLARRIQRIADAAGVGIWSIEGADDHVQWNAQMFHIYGLPDHGEAPPVKEWMGQRVHADDRARVAEERRRARRSGKARFETEFRIVRPDGSLRWVVCRSHRDLHEGQTVLYGIHLDVTQQRETDQALRLHEQRLKLTTQSAGLGIWELDLRTHTVIWEEQMYRLRGLTAADPRTPQQIDRQCIGDEVFDQRNHRIDRHLEEGAPFEMEYATRWPDGTLRWLASTGHAVRDEIGQALRMVGLNWDVTERKRAESALRDKEAAERASRAKSEFLARMSHELRTPLNAILGFAQLMQQDDSGHIDLMHQQQRVARIRTAGTHLLSLIDDVLDLATIEAGAQALELQPLTLDDVLDDVRHWLGTLAEQHGVNLEADGAGARVLADPRRLRQVLANLLSNAIKYNRRGGRAWVEVRASKRRGAAGWLIGVHDDGRGLSTAQLAHLFEPFNRLGAEREGIEGRGIGLATAHHLVRLMGGQLRARSRVGEGSEFHFWLKGAAAVADAVAQPAPAAAAPALSLLYVEDNPVNVLVMKELVGLRANISFRSAADGQSGVAQALRDPPDVVLVDMQLPDIDGYEVLRRLRARQLPSAMIALSANAVSADMKRARQAGFDDYWTKPIDFKTFLSALDQLAARRHGAGVAAAGGPQPQE